MPGFVVHLLLAAMPVVADRAAHSVTFTARATDVNPGTVLEFAFVGPDSDRAYEALFTTDARIADIAKAFDDAGIPRGQPVGQLSCRFWPAGKTLTIKPDIREFIKTEAAESGLPFVYTGGTRDANGTPFADTNMPSAVFSLYSLDQSLILLDDVGDQSAVYGRFLSGDKHKSGERYSFTITWDGKSGTEFRRLELRPREGRKALESLKGSGFSLDVMPVFSPDMTVSEARSIAQALAVIDSRAVRINGFEDGQFFYRGFLPDENWRIREKRLTQPVEVRIGVTNVVCTVIDEDWSVEGLDPKLTPHDETVAAFAKTYKGNTCLFYVRGEEKLSRIFELMKQLPKTICNWYVYVD